jgi:nucleoside-diphosphate-sugar epimerase
VRQPDITVAREVLGWEPQVPLAEGLKETVEYFSNGPKPAFPPNDQ